MRTTAKRSLFALLGALFGAFVMIMLVSALNRPVGKKEEVAKEQSRIVEVKRATPPPQPKPEPKPQSKPKKATQKAPMPNMNALLGGVAMNIPEFTTGTIAADASELLEEIAEDAIMTEDTVDVKPKVLSRAPLEYPKQAAKDGIKGYVIINLLIAKDGGVELAKILEAQPSGVFDEAALSSVQAWRFAPAKYRGKPVKIWAKQKIKFD
ncbi:MAG: energy transducer TonB [Campylobacterales bacterium]|nr:energy transducer TonB [Campylobacterales bacterium]